jgi:predicted RNA binding protein YcfA (HicA-like mRNA interferase family)
MPKSIPWKKLIKRFRELGFDGPYSGGRHLFMQKDNLRVHIPNPHKGDVSKDLVGEILRQAGISKIEWTEK